MEGKKQSARDRWSDIASLNGVCSVLARHEALAIFGTALALYSFFASCSFNEGDSFNFAQSLLNFDLVREQPHAPGYPLYVFLGRTLFLLTGNQLAALRWISIVSGALTLVPLYFLARSMYNRGTAVSACLILMVLPGFWLPSEKATTDALSTFLLTLGIALLYFGMKGHGRAIPVSYMVYALAVGVRPTNLAFVPLWLFATVKARHSTKIVFSGLAFVGTILAWLVPVVWVMRWDRFLLAMRYMYVGTASTDFVFARPLGLDPYERMSFVLASIFTFGFGGMLPSLPGLRFPFTSTSIPVYYLFHDFIWLGAILCSFLNFKKLAEKTFTFLWVVPHFMFVYLFGSPIHHRYFLPIFPPLILLIVSSIGSALKESGHWFRLSAKTESIVRNGVYVLLILTLVAHANPLAAKLHTEPSPVTQLVTYVKANYDSNDTTILVFHEYGAFQMYAPEFRCYHSRKQITENLRSLERQPTGRRTLLITSTAYEYLVGHSLLLRLEVTKIAEFYLDPRAEIEDHRVALYVVRAAQVSHGRA